MATLDQYRNMLRPNKHRLDDELEMHSEMHEQIGREVTKLAARVRDAEATLKKTEARIADDYREDGEKLSVEAVKAKVLRHRDRQEAWDRLQRAIVDHAEWEGLLDAWKTRGFNIRDLCSLYVASYFTIDTSYSSQKRADRPERRRDYSEGSQLSKNLSRTAERDEEPKPRSRRVLED